MNDNLIDLDSERDKRKPPNLDEVAAAAARYFFDPERLAKCEEPLRFASGKTGPNGEFVTDEDNKIDDDDIYEDRK